HARDRIMPVFLTAQLLRDADKALGGVKVVNEEWVNGLSIGYALEDLALHSVADEVVPGSKMTPSQRIITAEDLERWHVSSDELHAQALQNLVVHSHEHIMEGRRAEGCTI